MEAQMELSKEAQRALDSINALEAAMMRAAAAKAGDIADPTQRAMEMQRLVLEWCAPLAGLRQRVLERGARGWLLRYGQTIREIAALVDASTRGDESTNGLEGEDGRARATS